MINQDIVSGIAAQFVPIKLVGSFGLIQYVIKNSLIVVGPFDRVIGVRHFIFKQLTRNKVLDI
ncbi:hypothetical protein ES703_62098 [subsurface metagenome]